jgi:hypothetical protein
MIADKVTLEDLSGVREKFIGTVSRSLTQDERNFLVSFKDGLPEWQLLGLNGIEKLPAVQWKLRNIRELKTKNEKKHHASLAKLKIKLGL